jgi:hypothetical protein
MSEHEKVVAKLPSAAEIAAARAAAESGGQIYGWRDPSGTLLHRIAPDRRWLALIAHQAARLEEARDRTKAAVADTREFWRALIPEGPRCRDCADFDGHCQGDGPPCDPQAHALENLAKLKAALTAAEAEKERLRDVLAALVLNIDAGGATLGAMADARAALSEKEPTDV